MFTGEISTSRLGWKDGHSKCYPGLELFHVCRQIRHEAIPFPAKASFHLQASTIPDLRLLRHFNYMAGITTVQLETWAFCRWLYGPASNELDFLTELPLVTCVEFVNLAIIDHMFDPHYLVRTYGMLEQAIRKHRPDVSIKVRIVHVESHPSVPCIMWNTNCVQPS